LRKAMKMIGVIIPGLVNENYLGGIYRGIADTAKQNHCQLLTSIQNARRQDDLRYFFGRGGCDGAVLVAPYDYERMIDLCEQANCPCVLIDYTGARDAQMFPRVEVRNHEGITLVMEHLVRLGHRRIAFITGLMTQQSAQERLDGYRDGLTTAGIAYDPALVATGSWLPPENYTAAKALFQLDPLPTAIVASCDFGAFATYRVAQERGLVVGKDISITGFDDIRSASLADPPLTTVRQPIYRMGQVAVEMLVKRLNGEALCETYVRLETELIVRKSTGAVPSSA
jgi:LacI family transcriptional regulator